jgi:hypothetical protein
MKTFKDEKCYITCKIKSTMTYFVSRVTIVVEQFVVLIPILHHDLVHVVGSTFVFLICFLSEEFDINRLNNLTHLTNNVLRLTLICPLKGQPKAK